MNKARFPVLIPTFNNPTHLARMVEQLRSLGLTRIMVIDNASTWPPMLSLLASLEPPIRVFRREANHGPRSVLSRGNLDALPQFFAVTDPDLELNRDLPENFLERLAELTQRYRIGKAGFALDISEPERMITHIYPNGEPVDLITHENKYWNDQVDVVDGNPVYLAKLDTTFAVYNQRFFQRIRFLDAVRVAGRYTAKHIPWYTDFHLPPDEREFYWAHSEHSCSRQPTTQGPLAE